MKKLQKLQTYKDSIQEVRSNGIENFIIVTDN